MENHVNVDVYLEEIVFLLGNVCVNCPENIKMARMGMEVSLIQRLTQLPFKYFCDHKYQNVLFPTLIILCSSLDDDVNRLVAEEEIGLSFLALYIKAVESGDLQEHNPRYSINMRIPPDTIARVYPILV